jgi:hypothetical protein
MRILPVALAASSALFMAIGAASLSAKPAFQELLFNARWYRTYDSASSIIPAEGTLLFAWDFSDPEKKADSFFVGIDTLWGLPQDVEGDTAGDWDLQVCPDEICMNGLKAGIHGANSPYPFDGTKNKAEHHFQFFPAIDKNFDFTAPANSLFGALMYCRSRSTGASDTVFAFGAWKLKWDSTAPPPVRPVDGYLPRLSDFEIKSGAVRYLKAGSGIRAGRGVRAAAHGLKVVPEGTGLRVLLPETAHGPVQVELIGLNGGVMWVSGTIPPGRSEIFVPSGAGRMRQGMGIVRVTWEGGAARAMALLPAH